METNHVDRAWTPLGIGIAATAIFSAMWLGNWDFGVIRSWVAFFAILPTLLITGIAAHHIVQGEIKQQAIGTPTPRERKVILNLSRVMIGAGIVALVIGVVLLILVIAIIASLDDDDSLLFISLAVASTMPGRARVHAIGGAGGLSSGR